MKYYLKITFTILSILLFGSCQKDMDDTPESEWYQIVKIDTLASSDIIKSITGNSFGIGIDVVRASFLYHSKADDGIKTLSGCVCWPLRTATCSEIWLENHYTSSRWDQCPSQTPMPGMIRTSMFRSIYIGPDYQGLGLSRNLPQPYFNTVLLANQSIDCFKAALSLLKDWGPEISDNYSTHNIGYSLGGAVSLGVARRVELDPEIREIMHLKHSYCGAGPYDQVAMMDLFLSQPDEVLDLAVSLPFAIKSILFTSPSLSAKYSESDFFSQGLIESGILEKMDSRNYDTGVLNSMMFNSGFNTPRTIMSENLRQDNSPLAKDFRQELSKMDLTVGWTPTIPISLYHSKEDKIVPIVCLDSLKAKMGDNSKITIKVFETGSHQDTGTDFYQAVLL